MWFPRHGAGTAREAPARRLSRGPPYVGKGGLPRVARMMDGQARRLPEAFCTAM
ncbi:predicted protein [Streptomyces albidoflavus]|nr:predicted protein [Streptomyces albidoflavus]